MRYKNSPNIMDDILSFETWMQYVILQPFCLIGPKPTYMIEIRFHMSWSGMELTAQ